MGSKTFFLSIAMTLVTASLLRAEDATESSESQRLILAHYMPWYQASTSRRDWGWHWTMNQFDPNKIVDGKRQIASHYYPTAGPYDSGDPQILEYHLLLMKLAGIDGVIIDWYGLSEFRDYAMLHRNTQRLIQQVDGLGLRFVICYEDQTIPTLVDAGRLAAGDRVDHAVREIRWLAANWFSQKSYVRLAGQPVLLSFGQAGLTDEEWSRALGQFGAPVAYFSEHHRRSCAVGAFDWPIPSAGLMATERFCQSARQWPHAIPVAFPRFSDIYRQAGAGDGYGRIEDRDGATFRDSLLRAIKSDSKMIQIATWNDWGEGTNVEPSEEFGNRDLVVIQKIRREYLDAQFLPTARDLQLVHWLLQARRTNREASWQRQLDELADHLVHSRFGQAHFLRHKMEETE
jgi:hypothetical protein